MGDKINTSVDQLMKIVTKYDRLSFKDAAKELNVPIKTIREWVNVLEEEHLVQVVYSFTRPYIIQQTLSQTDKKAKIKRFTQKKDNLNVRLDMTAKIFSDMDKEMSEVAKIVDDVEKNMEQKLSHIGKDLQELTEAEHQKEKLDQQIIESKERSLAKIQNLEKHMQKSENNFENTITKIKKDFEADAVILQKNKSFVEKMHEQERILKKKLDECDALSKKIHADFHMQTKKVTDASEHMITLQKERATLLEQIEKEHKKLRESLAKSKKFESSVSQMQDKIYTKITDKIKALEKKQQGAKDLPKNIKKLIEKKTRLQNIISDLTHAQETAKNEVIRLKKESELLEKHIGMKNVDAELEKINEDISEMKKQKTYLTKKLSELYTVLAIKKR